MRHGFLVLSVAGAIFLLGALTLFWPGGAASAEYHGTVMDPPLTASDFALSNQRGEEFRLAESRGRVVILTFLYTSCTDVCPVVGVKLRQAYQDLGPDADRVDFVAISVDPARDSLERVAEYSRALDMFDRWQYVMGTEEELRPLWNDFLIGEPIIDEGPQPAPDQEVLESLGLYRGLSSGAVEDAAQVQQRFGGGYDVSHGTPIWLIGPEGNLRVLLGTDVAPKELVDDIRTLLRTG